MRQRSRTRRFASGLGGGVKQTCRRDGASKWETGVWRRYFRVQSCGICLTDGSSEVGASCLWVNLAGRRSGARGVEHISQNGIGNFRHSTFATERIDPMDVDAKVLASCCGVNLGERAARWGPVAHSRMATGLSDRVPWLRSASDFPWTPCMSEALVLAGVEPGLGMGHDTRQDTPFEDGWSGVSVLGNALQNRPETMVYPCGEQLAFPALA